MDVEKARHAQAQDEFDFNALALNLQNININQNQYDPMASLLQHAQIAIDVTKRALKFGSLNQIDHLFKSKGKSYLLTLLGRQLGNLIPYQNALQRMAITALGGLVAKAGNCGENSALAFCYLWRWCPKGTQLTYVTHQADHCYVIIGDPHNDNSIVVDPWPTLPTVCSVNQHTHGKPSPTEIACTGFSDATDGLDWAMSQLTKIPGLSEALAAMEKAESVNITNEQLEQLAEQLLQQHCLYRHVHSTHH